MAKYLKEKLQGKMGLKKVLPQDTEYQFTPQPFYLQRLQELYQIIILVHKHAHVKRSHKQYIQMSVCRLCQGPGFSVLLSPL